MIKEEFKDIITNIKEEIRTTQAKTMLEVNKNLIMLYFRLGKIIYDNSEYGNSFIKNVAMEIKLSFPNLKGFSSRNLNYMKLFYEEYKDEKNLQQLVANLPWGHNLLLIEKFKDKSDNPSIGLILCKDKDKITVNYSLKDINKPIGISSYQLSNIIPKNILEQLPTEEELNLHIDIE